MTLEFVIIILGIVFILFMLYFAIYSELFSIMVNYLKAFTIKIGKLLRFDKLITIISSFFNEVVQTFQEV